MSDEDLTKITFCNTKYNEDCKSPSSGNTQECLIVSELCPLSESNGLPCKLYSVPESECEYYKLGYCRKTLANCADGFDRYKCILDLEVASGKDCPYSYDEENCRELVEGSCRLIPCGMATKIPDEDDPTKFRCVINHRPESCTGNWVAFEGYWNGRSGVVFNKKAVTLRHQDTGSMVTIFNDGNMVIHSEKCIKIVAEESIAIKAQKNVAIEAGEMVSIKSGTKTRLCSHDETSIRSRNNLKIKSTNIAISCSQHRECAEDVYLTAKNNVVTKAWAHQTEANSIRSFALYGQHEAVLGLRLDNAILTGVYATCPHAGSVAPMGSYHPSSKGGWKWDREDNFLNCGLFQGPVCPSIIGDPKPDIEECVGSLSIAVHGCGKVIPYIDGARKEEVTPNTNPLNNEERPYLWPAKSPNKILKIEKDSTIRLQVIPDNNCYKITTLTVNDEEVSVDESGNVTLTQLRKDMDVTVSFSRRRVTVRVYDIENGTISPLGDQYLNCKDDLIITVAPDYGYRVSKIINGHTPYSIAKGMTSYTIHGSDPSDVPPYPEGDISSIPIGEQVGVKVLSANHVVDKENISYPDPTISPTLTDTGGSYGPITPTAPPYNPASFYPPESTTYSSTYPESDPVPSCDPLEAAGEVSSPLITSSTPHTRTYGSFSISLKNITDCQSVKVLLEKD